MAVSGMSIEHAATDENAVAERMAQPRRLASGVFKMSYAPNRAELYELVFANALMLWNSYRISGGRPSARVMMSGLASPGLRDRVIVNDVPQIPAAISWYSASESSPNFSTVAGGDSTVDGG